MDVVILASMGEGLRAAREARGLPRGALAEALGTRPVIVGRWERGEAVPSPGQARALAELLDLPPAAAAEWLAVAEQAAALAGPGRGWRLPGRQAGGWQAPPAGVAGRPPAPDSAPPSYLDDPAERRRYTLRWALTLVILAVLAVSLIWALGALADGWRGLVELFRDGPPAGEPAAAFGPFRVL